MHLRLPPDLQRTTRPQQRLHNQLALIDVTLDPQRVRQFDFEVRFAAEQPNLTHAPIRHLETRPTPGAVGLHRTANAERRAGAMDPRAWPGDVIGAGVGIVIELAARHGRVEHLEHSIAPNQNGSARSFLRASLEVQGYGQFRTINAPGDLDFVNLNLGRRVLRRRLLQCTTHDGRRIGPRDYTDLYLVPHGHTLSKMTGTPFEP